MLATHLSFPEIATELFLSPHIIKSQAVSLYWRLGASSQSQEVARAGEPGMLGRVTTGLYHHPGDEVRPRHEVE